LIAASKESFPAVLTLDNEIILKLKNIKNYDA
jgi:hypothetical protein